jgi:uncharacterized Zn-binding protein involved in type VI secretion
MGGLEVAAVGHRITHEDDLPDPREIALIAARLGTNELCKRQKNGLLLSVVLGMAIGKAQEELDEAKKKDADKQQENECPDPCGVIELGSENVFVGREQLMVAMVEHEKVPCEDHSDKPIRMGSPDVFVNKKPIARRTDETACGAFIGEGEATVFIGAQTKVYAEAQRGVAQTALNHVVHGALNRQGGSVGGLSAGDSLALGAALATWVGGAIDSELDEETQEKASKVLDSVMGSEVGEKLAAGDVDGAKQVVEDKINDVQGKIDEIKDKL